MSTSNTILHLKPPDADASLRFSRRKSRFFRRRGLKIKTSRRITRLCATNNNEFFLEPLQNFLPSPNSLDVLAPVLGLASGLTLYLSRFKSYERLADLGEWILFSSPTPFNRFVLLRCPSISFEGSELLEDVNEKLVEEERHFVRLNSGRIKGGEGSSNGFLEKLKYQRVCISTEDGGVISIDWPANLELEEEHGFDTTLLLVPGTPEGSLDTKVRSFVCEALGRGFFPVVMNPRGCANSPLTTARLFTAADSDDISTAIQFIHKTRPWSTLMAIGWGYGANMLTKYLAEAGETTPLTAATCINNPFDLEEATRCSPYHNALDQKLTGGLINILQSNKELFQGRAKGFDVEKGLLSKSVRDFEKSISMVSYGFDEIEDFYSKSSTRGVIGNVKIPVLYIQSDDGTVPLFSIPRSLIAENPFTSLLLCSCVSPSAISSGRDVVSWCQNLTIEWLAAVELGLLKGRHPLLKDIDVTINPAKGLALVEGQVSNKGDNKLLDLTLTDADKYTVDSARQMIEENTPAKRLPSTSRGDSNGHLKLDNAVQKLGNDALQHTNYAHEEEVKDENMSAEDTERGQVLQTAQVVMNMLDATMPGALSEEEKSKVLTAVGQGETFMKALQDAVPEDVRGKLTTSISGILQAQRTNLKLDGLLDISKITNVSSTPKSNIQEKEGTVSSADESLKDSHSLDHMKMVEGSSESNRPQSDKSASGQESGQDTHKPTDLVQPQVLDCQQGDSSGMRKGTNESGNNDESDAVGREKAALHSDNTKKVEEPTAMPNSTSYTERTGSNDEVASDEHKVKQDDGIYQPETKREINTQKHEEKVVDTSTDKNRVPSGNTTEEASTPPISPTESQSIESNDNQKKENVTNQPLVPVVDQSIPADSDSHTFSVVQALDALTGMDDSTQVAVNSVFGVIEDIIDQLGEEKNDEDKTQETLNESSSEKQHLISDHPSEREETNDNDLEKMVGPELRSVESDDSLKKATSKGWVEEDTENPVMFSVDGTANTQGDIDSMNDGEVKDGGKLLAENTDLHVHNVPLYVTPNIYRDYLHNEYFRRYLLSKIPSSKPMDLNTTAALLLDYFPEDGQWKLLEQPGNVGEPTADVAMHKDPVRKNQTNFCAEVNDTDSYIEPAYVVLDTERKQEPVEEYNTLEKFSETVEDGDDKLEKLMRFVKTVILDSLRVEVGRKLSAADMKKMEPNLARDLEEVANAVSLAVGNSKDENWSLLDYRIGFDSQKVGTLDGEHVIRTISLAMQGTNYLRRVLPIGVIVGSSLAALRKYFNVAPRHDNGLSSVDQLKRSGEKCKNERIKDLGLKSTTTADQTISSNGIKDGEERKVESKNRNNDNVMVGAVTAALGASALLVQQQHSYKGNEIANGTSTSLKEKAGSHQKAVDKLDEVMSEKDQNNVVASLAEKAMSVAGPVVPTKEDGELDQERLVAMLTDLGQKGGMLRLVGKIALLWGGIRGAMSLTDKLIMFLHIAERPLHQRVLAFVGMVLVLWSPVVVPLLPTIVQSWTTNQPSRFAELVSIIGLYTAVMILVMLWGRRIREYEDPAEQYGLDLITLPKIQSLLKGLIGGVMLVLSIQTVNALLGCASFSWPSNLSSVTLDAVTRFKAYGKMIVLAGRGIITATGVVLVEELLFRSWLPEEIAADLGYHQGIILAGLAFSLIQRSPLAIPGLWLLSLALAGLRQQNEGSLAIPIGLRAGIMASSFVLQTGGFLKYSSNLRSWLTGTHPFEPFSGVVGLAFSLVLAFVFCPREPLQKKKKLRRIIRE